MLSDINGNAYNESRSIFPIITFIRGHERFKCLGTGFIIKEEGGFVTAKHVIEEYKEGELYAIQHLSDGTPVTRKISYLSWHPKADIALGFLGKGRDGKARPISHELAPKFRLSFRELDLGDEISSYGYPLTKDVEICNKTTFRFTGDWAKGNIESYHPLGCGVVTNRCYQSSMFFDNGASGGPVIKDGYVIGVNSASMRCEIPYSFITPIDYLLEFSVWENEKWIPFKNLVDDGHIEGVY